jgi:hypothetical protein
MNALKDNWKLSLHTACYYDLVADSASVALAYMSGNQLVVTYYETFNKPILHDLAKVLKEKSTYNRKFFINNNEPLALLLGTRNTTQITFNPEIEDTMLAYKRAFVSLMREEKIITLEGVELNNGPLCINVLCLILKSFQEYIFGDLNHRKIYIPAGGKIENPFSN